MLWLQTLTLTHSTPFKTISHISLTLLTFFLLQLSRIKEGTTPHANGTKKPSLTQQDFGVKGK